MGFDFPSSMGFQRGSAYGMPSPVNTGNMAGLPASFPPQQQPMQSGMPGFGMPQALSGGSIMDVMCIQMQSISQCIQMLVSGITSSIGLLAPSPGSAQSPGTTGTGSTETRPPSTTEVEETKEPDAPEQPSTEVETPTSPKKDEPTPEVKAEMEHLRSMPGNSKMDDETMIARAKFNLSGKSDPSKYNLDELDDYLPYRDKTRSQDPAKTAELDKRVLEVAKKLNVSYTETDSADRGKVLDDKKQDADFATKVSIAAQLVTFTQNRPDILNKVLDSGRFKMVVADQYHVPGSAGKDETLTLDQNAPFGAKDHKLSNVIVHEFGHITDSIEQDGADGILWNMSGASQGKLKDIRQSLKEEFERTKKMPEGWGDDYCFKSDVEFTAEMNSLFFEAPKAMQAKSPELYNVFKDYYKIDPAGSGWNEQGT